MDLCSAHTSTCTDTISTVGEAIINWFSIFKLMVEQLGLCSGLAPNGAAQPEPRGKREMCKNVFSNTASVCLHPSPTATLAERHWQQCQHFSRCTGTHTEGSKALHMQSTPVKPRSTECLCWKPQAMLPASKDTGKTKVSRGGEKATGQSMSLTPEAARACMATHTHHTQVRSYWPWSSRKGQVQWPSHSTLCHKLHRWLIQMNRSLFWPKPPGQITLQSNGNWRTHEMTAPKPAGTCHARPGWHRWHGGHRALLPSGVAGSSRGGHTQAEGWSSWAMTRENWMQRGKNDLQQIKCAWVDVCPFSRFNHQQEGDRDAEMVKQIASHQPAWAYHEMDRWSWEPLTLTTQKGGSALENTQISQTHNTKINISMGYDLQANP